MHRVDPPTFRTEELSLMKKYKVFLARFEPTDGQVIQINELNHLATDASFSNTLKTSV